MATENSDQSLTNLRILVAEDNLVNQKVALRILKYLGYQADVAINGEETIKAIANQAYDLILMDVQMPKMDGLEATKRIRQNELDLNTPPILIIAMTANGSDEDRNICDDAGMNDYISKPIQIEILKNILQHYELLKVQNQR
jgi:CheY-like chemotaxis protein